MGPQSMLFVMCNPADCAQHLYSFSGDPVCMALCEGTAMLLATLLAPIYM